jgi:hypothetical protein
VSSGLAAIPLEAWSCENGEGSTGVAAAASGFGIGVGSDGMWEPGRHVAGDCAASRYLGSVRCGISWSRPVPTGRGMGRRDVEVDGDNFQGCVVSDAASDRRIVRDE